MPEVTRWGINERKLHQLNVISKRNKWIVTIDPLFNVTPCIKGYFQYLV